MSNEDLFRSPYSPSESTDELPVDPYAANMPGYPGIGRGFYFLSVIGVFLSLVFLYLVNDGTWGTPVLIGMVLFLVAVNIAATAFRLINQGSSGWLALLAAVPIANLYIWLRCLVCPEGYAEHRTLDLLGKVAGVLALCGTLFLIGAGAILVSTR